MASPTFNYEWVRYFTLAKSPKPYRGLIKSFKARIKPESLQQINSILENTARTVSLDVDKPNLSHSQIKNLIALELDWNRWLEKLEDSTVKVKIIDEEEKKSYFRQRLVIKVESLDTFEALLLIPKQTKQLNPAILGLHGHGGSMDDFAQMLMGNFLADRGYIVLIPDFKAMQDPLEEEVSREFFRFGKHLMSTRLYESDVLLKLLHNLPDISIGRIGLLANSGGSAVAHLLLRLNDKIKAVVTDYDSSFYFSWQEFCCESVPALAHYSQQINDRTSFGIPALKAPYYFAPDEEKIEKFFAKHLATDSVSVLGIETRNRSSLFNLIMNMISNSLEDQDSKTEAFLKRMSSAKHPSISDQELLILLESQLIFGIDKYLIETFNALRLSHSRKIALKMITRGLNFESMTETVQNMIVSEITLMPDNSEKLELLFDVSKYSALAGVTNFTLKLLALLQFDSELYNSVDGRNKLENIIGLLFEHKPQDPSLIKFCESLPVDFAIVTVAKNLRKLKLRKLDDSAKKFIQVTMRTKWKTLNLFQKKLIYTVLTRDYPTFSLDSLEIPNISQIVNECSQYHYEILAKELLLINQWVDVFHFVDSLEKKEKVELLYKICIFCLDKNIPQRRLLKIFSDAIDDLSNPAGRAGLREEIVNELLDRGYQEQALRWLKLAHSDVRKIELKYNREEHAKRLALIAAKVGFESEMKSLIEILPWTDRRDKFRESLKRQFNTQKANLKPKWLNRPVFDKALFSKILFTRPLQAMSLLDGQVSWEAHDAFYSLKDVLIKHIYSLDDQKRIESTLDVAKTLFSMNLRKEGNDLVNQILIPSSTKIKSSQWIKLYELYCFFEDVKLFSEQSAILKHLLKFYFGGMPDAQRDLFMQKIIHRLQEQETYQISTINLLRQMIRFSKAN